MDSDNRDPRTYAIVGAAMEVHGQLGCGFLEAVYHEALAAEFASRTIAFGSEIELPVFYKGRQLTTFYRADFVCYGEVIVELKALAKLSSIEERSGYQLPQSHRLRGRTAPELRNEVSRTQTFSLFKVA